MHKSRKIVESFNCAIEGIIQSIKNERHMKVHLVMTVVVIIATLILNLTKLEIALIAISISIVWIAEIINTAIEAVVDMYIQEYHDLAKLAKDAGAGAVFIAAVNSIIVGYLVMYNHFELFSKAEIHRLKSSPVHASAVALLLVVVIVIGLKALFRKGTPLRGGMPSGHSAVAFSVWVSIFFINDNIYITLLTFFLACMVAQTRVKAGIHTFKEVGVGAVIGSSVTYLILFVIRNML